jgi:hypothetical protein
VAVRWFYLEFKFSVANVIYLDFTGWLMASIQGEVDESQFDILFILLLSVCLCGVV